MGFLTLEKTRDIELDSPETIAIHRDVILHKPFLRKYYEGVYAIFRRELGELSTVAGQSLELGSGGGFLKKVLPDVITSDVSQDASIDKVIEADHLPFPASSLKVIFLLNVLHHIKNPETFFREADRCLVTGGRVVMVEPYNSFFSRILYKRFHHEPFDENAETWNLDGDGRLTDSNQAMPWIIFWRDRARFETRFPRLRIRSREPHTVFSYILSGGLTLRAMAPAWSFSLWHSIDRLLSNASTVFPIFQTIILEKV